MEIMEKNKKLVWVGKGRGIRDTKESRDSPMSILSSLKLDLIRKVKNCFVPLSAFHIFGGSTNSKAHQ